MAGRIRSIKPEVLDDDVALDLSDTAWRLWVSSWVLADDHGRFRASPRYLAAEVWKDTARKGDAAKALDELARAGLLRRYVVDGEQLAELKPEGWRRHQRIDHPGRPRIRLPGEGTYTDPERRKSPAGRPRSDEMCEHESNDSAHLADESRETFRDSREVSADTAQPSDTLAPRVRARDLVGGPGPTPCSDPGSSGSLEPDPRSPLSPPGGGKEPSDVPKAVRKKPKTGLPNGWAPRPEEVAKAATYGLDVEHERALFVETHQAKGNVYADWNAAFRTWLLRAKEYRGGQGQSGTPPTPDEVWSADRWVKARERQGLPVGEPEPKRIAELCRKASGARAHTNPDGAGWVPSVREIVAHWIRCYLRDKQDRAGGIEDQNYPLAFLVARCPEGYPVPTQADMRGGGDRMGSAPKSAPDAPALPPRLPAKEDAALSQGLLEALAKAGSGGNDDAAPVQRPGSQR